MREGARDACGLVVVDKERGWTSHDVVAKARTAFGQRRIGHAGTLDPDATGLLLVGVGRATRLLRFLTALPKSYVGEVVLGLATTTLDAAGEVVGRWDMSSVSESEVAEAARGLTGEIMQVPPMVSAVKVGGRRLHELAREGAQVEREPRRVVVHRLRTLPTRDPAVVGIEVDCSSGTYVRALASSLGEALGGGAHLRNLRRVAVGSFSERDARRVGDLSADCILSPAEGLRDYPRLRVSDETASCVRNGVALDRARVGAAGTGPWAVVDSASALLAVYEEGEVGRLRPAVVLASA